MNHLNLDRLEERLENKEKIERLEKQLNEVVKKLGESEEKRGVLESNVREQ